MRPASRCDTKTGTVVAVRPIIEEISNAGYRLSSRLVSGVLEMAGE